MNKTVPNENVPGKPMRVLVIINTMDAGGAETFIMKVYRTLDKSKVQFDFLINKKEKCFYEDEINEMGGLIYRGVSKSKNPFKSFSCVYRTVKDKKYSTVMSIAVHPLAAVDLLAAKIGGARKRLVRSTNSSAGGGRSSDFFAKIFRPLVCSLATTRLAPSTEAAVWLFGVKAVKNEHVNFITNGIEIDKYIFDEQIRLEKRCELNIEDKFVIGHVGRFNKQKNHMFLLDVFSELSKQCPEAVLVMVGTGELESIIKDKAIAIGVGNRVIFTGVRKDVPNLLMAMDVLIFPSLYEGMPNVVIEAQATGLPCIVSDTITKEAKITPLVNYLPLNATIAEWVEKAIFSQGKQARNEYNKEVIKKGFDIRTTTEYIAKFIGCMETNKL